MHFSALIPSSHFQASSFSLFPSRDLSRPPSCGQQVGSAQGGQYRIWPCRDPHLLRGVLWPGFNPIHVAWEHLVILGWRIQASGSRAQPYSSECPKKGRMNLMCCLPFPTGCSPHLPVSQHCSQASEPFLLAPRAPEEQQDVSCSQAVFGLGRAAGVGRLSPRG